MRNRNSENGICETGTMKPQRIPDRNQNLSYENERHLDFGFEADGEAGFDASDDLDAGLDANQNIGPGPGPDGDPCWLADLGASMCDSLNTDSDARPSVSSDLDDDGQIGALFCAFDQMSASSELRDRALQAALASASQQPQTAPASAVQASQSDGQRSSTRIITFPISANGKRSRTRSRKVALIAAAACLTLALTGTTAWATPTAHVHIGEGTASIGIDVNCFGRIIDTSSDSEEVSQRIADMHFNGRPADEALEEAMAIIDDIDAENPLTTTVDARFSNQRETLQGEADEAVQRTLQERAAKDRPADQPDGRSADQPDSRSANQPDGQSANQPDDQPADQPSNQPVDQPTERFGDQPTTQPASLPASQPSDQPADAPSSQPGEQPMNDQGPN